MADKYLGTNGGEDFSTVKDMEAWLVANPLSGDQNIYVTSGGIDSVTYTPGAITTNGHHLNISVEDSTWESIRNNPLNWFNWEMGEDCGLVLLFADLGTYSIQRLRVSATHKNSGNPYTTSLVGMASTGGTSRSGTYNFKNMIVVGGENQPGVGTNKDCVHAGCSFSNPHINVERVVAVDSVRHGINTAIATLSPGSYLGQKFIKNCAAINCVNNGMLVDCTERYFGSTPYIYDWTVQNSYSVENGVDWYWDGDDIAVKQALADSDLSLPDTAGMQRGITIGDEVQSTDITSSDWLKLIRGRIDGSTYTPGSAELGQTGVDSGLSVDIIGNGIPDDAGYYPIGPFAQQYFTCHDEIDAASRANIRKFHSKIEVTWTDSFIDNTTAATANDTNRIHDVTSLISQTMDGVTAVPRRWAHLDDTIVADGTFYPMPGTTLLAATNQVGWWGKEECNSDGEWIQSTTTTTTTMTPNQYPTLTTTFASRPIYSLLVCGDNIYGEYPRSFEIKVYTLSTDTVPVYTDSVTDDVGTGWVLSNVVAGDAQAVKWDKTLTTSIDSCQKIELIIKKWNVGLRVVKISEFYTAITETYTDDDILSMKLLEESEIADGSLPVGNISCNELDFKLQNVENRFFWGNTDSPLHDLIKINRRIRAWIGIELADDSIYYVLLGTFFSGDWDAQELGTDVSTAARDRMELLRKADYETSPLNENITLYDLAVLVLDDAKTKITDLEYNISTDLQNYTLPYGWFEKQSYFKCLKQIAGACMGRAYMDRDDVLQIDTDL